MTVVPFKRPPQDRTNGVRPPVQRGRPVSEFAIAMLATGVIFFLLLLVWPTAPRLMLAAIHLVIALVYFREGPRIAAGVWITLSLAVLVLTNAPSPVTLLLAMGAAAVR